MRVSIIIPLYKDLVALKLILNALEKQTYKNFEVIIAEDDNAKETKDFLNNLDTHLEIQHFSQKNDGNKKAMILNKVLPHTKGEYIIFIDGDVIPYTTFIQSHIDLSEEKTVLCGRRVNMGDKVSKDLRDGKITSFDLENSYFRYFKYITNDNSRHYEQGIRFNPSSLIYKVLSNNDKNVHIVGSNFSCFRKDLLNINGFDEDIIGGSKDDVDLEWRFVQSGCSLKTCKFCANMFHLNHKRASRVDDEEIAKQQMAQNKKIKKYRCTNGIKKL